MYPFGHEATRIATTERQLAGQNGKRARLVKRDEIFIREEVQAFKGTDGIARQFPFTEIEILTTSTPAGTFKAVTGSAGYLERGPAIDVQKMKWNFRTGVHKQSGVSLKALLPNIPPGGYTREHQDTAQSRYRQRPAPPSSVWLSA
jgi:hypothetical protein